MVGRGRLAAIECPALDGYVTSMDQRTFVNLLRSAVLDGLSSELVKTWQHPSGLLRSEERSQRSDWLNKMSLPDRQLLEAFGTNAARSALFGVLAVLDGSRKIDESSGHLELCYVSDEGSKLLASSASEMPVLPLHELLP